MTAAGAALENLYAVFASYRASAVAGCPCCVTEEERKRLHARRLRELSATDLDAFAFSALNTWGTLTDLKHFLPRILELYAARELSTDLQILYGKIVQEGPWADVERKALEGFARALLVDAVSGGAHRSHAMDILESAGLAAMDVTGMLEHAFACEAGVLDPAHASSLAALVEVAAPTLASGAPAWIWWKTGNTRALEHWLLAGRPYTLLVNAFEAASDHRDAGDWAAACDILEALGGKR